MARPIVLVHGYSDSYEGFEEWRKILAEWGRPAETIHVGNYVSLSNEVTLKDVAEGFDRALRREVGLGPDEEFDAMVHSTGMLVVRAWLNSYSEGARRRARLKHLVAFAPATNGSPLAHKGRSWLGSVFKGNRSLGPDFMEAGKEILYGLELASRFTWELAHDDLIRDNARFRPGPDTPFVFTFCGNRTYGFLHDLVTDSDGTDGTVRWAGCALNSRKIDIDLTVPEAGGDEAAPGLIVSDWANQGHPLILLDRLDHGTIVSKPSSKLKKLVRKALEVETSEAFEDWNEDALQATESDREGVPEWQQFVIRVVDERGDPVPDWNAKLYTTHNARRSLRSFGMDVHAYERDPSLRCFHVNLDELEPDGLHQLWLHIIASTGTRLVGYHGVSDVLMDDVEDEVEGTWEGRINLSGTLSRDGDFNLFFPFTTTFVEIRLNREPMPPAGRNDVFWFP